jgi:hypothetical protein
MTTRDFQTSHLLLPQQLNRRFTTLSARSPTSELDKRRTHAFTHSL